MTCNEIFRRQKILAAKCLFALRRCKVGAKPSWNINVFVRKRISAGKTGGVENMRVRCVKTNQRRKDRRGGARGEY